MTKFFRNQFIYKKVWLASTGLLVGLWGLLLPSFLLAASLSIAPATGVYTVGNTFTVRVTLNTEGKPVNSADGEFKFNPQELSVVSINSASSIFDLWVTKPTFSNTAGTISFSGGTTPPGFTGSNGTVFTITFSAKSASTAKVLMTSGSILAFDGLGTNIITGMNGGSFTIGAPSSQPVPEVVQYVAPANTPKAPVVSSASHPADQWSKAKTAALEWSLPSGVTAVRTSLDQSPSTIPTKVYDTPIRNISLSDLPEGVSYFHIQFKNAEGWGAVTHWRLAVDSEKPTNLKIDSPADADFTNSKQTLLLQAEDETSGIAKYSIKVDDREPFEFINKDKTGQVEIVDLKPGFHSVTVEAFDQAGNGIVNSYNFTITAFEKPVFTEYPSEINEEVIPVILGKTKPRAEVEVIVRRVGMLEETYSVKAGDDGVFTFIPAGRFATGVYEITAQATDEFGSQSEFSDAIRIAVQQPGYIQIGSKIISFLSLIVPLIALLVILLLSISFLIGYFRKFRRRLAIETDEVLAILETEFISLRDLLELQRNNLAAARRTKKLTVEEEEMMKVVLKALSITKAKIRKEVLDVDRIVKKKANKE